MKKSLLTPIGMQESSEFSTSKLSTMAQSRHRLISSESISFGFDGLVVMFHFTVDGKRNGCIVLNF